MMPLDMCTQPRAPRKPKVAGALTKKDLEGKLKAATDTELRDFVRTIMTNHTDSLRAAWNAWTPHRLPTKPRKDDPLFNACFHCASTSNLDKFRDVQICATCSKVFEGSSKGKTE